MAIDFLIDNKGDFVFSNIEQYPRLRIDWIDSTQPTLRIDFEQTEERSTFSQTDKQFRIDFITDRDNRTLDAKAATVTGKYELRQRIMLKLRTELGELRLKPDFGSYIVTQRHEDIRSQSVQSMIQSIVLSEVRDILDNPRVSVIPRRKTGTPFYCQNINVYIYNDEELLFVLEV